MHRSNLIKAFLAAFLFQLAVVSGLGQSVSVSYGFGVFQATGYTANQSPRSSHSWTFGNALPGFSGTGYMTALPANGATLSTAQVASSPELQYTAVFSATGNYYVWLNGYAVSGTTVHVGLDESEAAQMALGGTGAWVWTNNTASSTAPVSITVSSTGSHTFSIWMADAGVSVDAVVLNLNSNYLPAANSTFWQNQTIYQVITDRFYDGDATNDNADGNYDPSNGAEVHGGDFKGLEEKLDYIKALGATAIWISPVVHNFFGNYHGYAGSDFYNVDPHWGALADLQHMIQEAHRRGLCVIDDVVCNHGSTLLGSSEAGYTTTFLYPPNGYPLEYLNSSNQYSPPFDSKTTPNLEALFHNNGVIQNYGDTTQEIDGALDDLDDFNTESTYIQSCMEGIYQYWLSTAGFDAFRVDTVVNVDNPFWQIWCPSLHGEGPVVGKPNFFMFGEVYNGSDQTVGYYTGTEAGGPYEFDSVVDYPLYFMVNSVFANATGNTQQIENRYDQLATYYAPEAQNQLVTFLDNHDQPRFLSSANADGNTSRLDVALAFLYTARGIPCLYYGTEQGFDGGADPDNREDMFAGQFQDNGETNVDNFNEASPLFQLVAQLNNFKRLYPALRTGTHVNQWNDPNGPGLFAYSRRLGSQEVFVVFNTSGSSQTISTRSSIYPVGTVVENLLSPSETYTVASGPQFPSITVPASTAKVFIAQSQVLPLDPVVTSLTPAHDTQNVPTSTPLVITFSRSMNTASVQAAFSTAPATTGMFTWSTMSSANDTLTYTPAGGWAANTQYGVHLASTAADAVSGNVFYSPFDMMFSTGSTISQALPPTVTEQPPSGLGTTSATLNANVNPNGASTTCHFQYGRNTNYGSTTSTQSIGSGAAVVPVSAGISGLRSGRTYHFRLVATNANGTTDGADASFVTPTSGTPAVANTGSTSGITTTTAVVNGSVIPNGNATNAYFQYGVTPTSTTQSPWASTLLQAEGTGNTTVQVSTTLTGLSPGTTYYYAVTATNALSVSLGSTLTFETLASPLVVVTSSASAVTGSSATLNGTVTPNGLAAGIWFEYGPTTAYGSSTRQAASDNAESYTGWDYGSDDNGGTGFGPATFLSGTGGGLYLSTPATGGREIDGTNSFGVYAGSGTQALHRAIDSPGNNGIYMLSARFDVSNSVGVTAFNLKSAPGNSFSSGELISFGLNPSDGSNVIFVQGSTTQTINLGSAIPGSIIDFMLYYDAGGSYTLGAKFRANTYYTTVSGTLEETGSTGADIGFENLNTGNTQNLIFDDLVSMTSTSMGSGMVAVPVSFALTGLTPGTTYHYRVDGINQAGIVYGPDMAFTTLTPLQAWRLQYFGTTNPNDPVGGDASTPLNDGVPNLLKYALGMNPTVAANRSLLPYGGISGSYLTITFTREQYATDITYHVDGSSDLVTWTEIWNSSTVAYSGAGASQQVTVPDTVAMTPGGPRFLRVRITNP